MRGPSWSGMQRLHCYKGYSPPGDAMPEIFFTGPAGRLEGRFHPAKQRNAPIAILLHPHPQFGGTMNNQIVYQMYYAFAERGFHVLRFNFRGVGRSRAISTMARENCRTQPARLTGRSRRTRKRAPAGSPASRSARGLACSC